MTTYVLSYRANKYELKELYWTQCKSDLTYAVRDLFDFFALISTTHEILAECSVSLNSSYYHIDLKHSDLMQLKYYDQLIPVILLNLTQNQRKRHAQGIIIQAIPETPEYYTLQTIMKQNNGRIQDDSFIISF